MNILDTLKQLRDDIKTWVTNNLNALNAKIDEKTIPIDSELSSTSTNPVQNQAISKEIDSINDRVGDTPVATQISQAINAQEHFSGDYNDLINAPDISEDGSGNMIIADESGNIIFKADTDGIHTTAVTINGEKAASEKFVEEAVAAIDIPETDFTGYAKESYVDEAIANIEFPKTDFTGYATETYVDNKVADLVNSAPEALNTLGELASALENHEDAYDALLETVGSKATHSDLENLKDTISESIVSETDEFHIVDDEGNIVASIDENGVATTIVTAQRVVFNGNDLETKLDNLDSKITDHIDDADIHVTSSDKDSWNNKVDKVDGKSLSTNDFTDEYKAKLETLENITFEETDPTVPAWAKEPNKPSYNATEIGLGNVDNTSDADKPVSTATQAAIDELRKDLSESIVSEADEWKIVDEAGNIIANMDANGFETTAINTKKLTIDGNDISSSLKEISDKVKQVEDKFDEQFTQYIDDLDALIGGDE